MLLRRRRSARTDTSTLRRSPARSACWSHTRTAWAASHSTRPTRTAPGGQHRASAYGRMRATGQLRTSAGAIA
jgi:hypothetical protein